MTISHADRELILEDADERAENAHTEPIQQFPEMEHEYEAFIRKCMLHAFHVKDTEIARRLEAEYDKLTVDAFGYTPLYNGITVDYDIYDF